MVKKHVGRARIFLDGDKEKAHRYIGEARKVLGIAHELNKNRKQFIYQRKFSNGLEVLVKVIKGVFDNIYIRFPSGGIKWTLLFSPTYNINEGWGAPFASQDAPFGTALTPTSSHDERHKSATVTVFENKTITVEHQYGVQFGDPPEFPGNRQWTDGEQVVTWWGNYGIAQEVYLGHEIFEEILWSGVTPYYWKNVIPGQIGYVYTGPAASAVSQGLCIMESHTADAFGGFTYTKLKDINNQVWVDGTKYLLPQFNNIEPDAHRWVTGIGKIGDWLIYSDKDFTVNPGDTLDPGFNPAMFYCKEYVNAFNIETLQYLNLGWFKSESVTGYQDDLLGNSMPIQFNKDCTEFITARRYGAQAPPNLQRIIGTIAYDQSGVPTGITVSRSVQLFTYWYSYGYDLQNVRVDYGFNNTGSGFVNAYNAIDSDASSGFYLGILEKWKVEPRGYYLVVGINGKIFTYACTTATYETAEFQVTTPTHTYDDLSSFHYGFPIEYGSNYLSKCNTASVIDAGAFISIPKSIKDALNGPIQYDDLNRDIFNVFVDINGGMVDMGDALLNNTVSGPLLTTSPMVVLKNI